MLTTVQLLDLAKSRHSCSDYKLSFLLEVVPSAVKNYRSGRSHPDDRVVRKLAELTGLDAGQLAIWMQAERARDEESRELWTEIARRFEGLPTTAIALFLALFISYNPDAGATPQNQNEGVSIQAQSNSNGTSLYIMLTRWYEKTARFIARFLNFTPFPDDANLAT